MKLGFWLRWSWRDLRARWVQVVAVALIIAFGAAVYAGLGGMESWLTDSYDESYAMVNMYDIRLELTDGGFMAEDDLRAILEDVPGIEASTLRLTTQTLLDASQDDQDILVRGQLVGVEVSDALPYATAVNSISIAEDDDLDTGRNLNEADTGQNVAVVEYKFARFHELDAGATLRLSGDVPVELVGIGYSPEYFLVVTGETSFEFGNEGSYAVLFMPLESVQQITGRESLVNNAAILVAEGFDPAAVSAEIAARMATTHPEIGFTSTLGADDPIRVSLYADAEGDQEMWNLLASIFLLGAAFGTFNLAGRMVESQRRQIGIGMALGVPRLLIAFRPMLVGLQIAVLGTAFGLILGWFIGLAFASFVTDFFPLPYFEYSFYLPGFLRAMALGVTLPILATLIPVWRAVRVAPVDAIQTGHLVAKGGGLAGMLKNVPLPGNSFIQLPIKNVLRAPWRTALTMLGVGLAIVIMILFSGFLDSFGATLKQSNRAYTYQADDRIMVIMDFFYPTDNADVGSLLDLRDESGTPLFAESNANLLLGGQLIGGDETLDVLLELIAFDEGTIWQPNLLEGSIEPDGLILSQKAATDLGVGVGDSITLSHPMREGAFAFRLEQSDFKVIAIHDHPIRAYTYLPLEAAQQMGLAGLTNYLILTPNEGVELGTIKAALFNHPGVVSVQSIDEVVETFDEILALFTTFLAVVQVIVVIMAFLIAFNSTSINVDERVREIATMFAFGLPVWRVTRMQMLENLVIGIFGTLIGIVLGRLLLAILISSRVSEQIADIQLLVTLTPLTLVMAFALGVVTVTLTPLFSLRKMFKMDIPSTLRVME